MESPSYSQSLFSPPWSAVSQEKAEGKNEFASHNTPAQVAQGHGGIDVGKGVGLFMMVFFSSAHSGTY